MTTYIVAVDTEYYPYIIEFENLKDAKKEAKEHKNDDSKVYVARVLELSHKEAKEND